MKPCADEIHNAKYVIDFSQGSVVSRYLCGYSKDSSKRYQEGFYQEDFSTCNDAMGTISGPSSGYR